MFKKSEGKKRRSTRERREADEPVFSLYMFNAYIYILSLRKLSYNYPIRQSRGSSSAMHKLMRIHVKCFRKMCVDDDLSDFSMVGGVRCAG